MVEQRDLSLINQTCRPGGEKHGRLHESERVRSPGKRQDVGMYRGEWVQVEKLTWK